jgi:hypothetical protein
MEVVKGGCGKSYEEELRYLHSCGDDSLSEGGSDERCVLQAVELEELRIEWNS